MNSIKYISISATLLILSGCTAYHLKSGDEAYQNKGYSEAITHYEEVLEKKENPEALAKLAQSYGKVNELKKAEDTYGRLMEVDDLPIHQLQYARVLKENGKIQEAKKWYRSYLKEVPDNETALMEYHSTDSISTYHKDSFIYQLNPIEIPANGSVFAPAIYLDGMVFTSENSDKNNPKINAWTGKPYLDLYYSPLKGQDIETPEPFDNKINSPYHDGPATFNAAGDEIFLTRSNLKGRRLIESDDDENNIMLYHGKKIEGKWKKIQKMTFNDDAFSTGHPALSKDGTKLFFISDRPGGYGGTDIYQSDLKNGEWSEPQNLGPNVNSPGDEMFPYLYETEEVIRLYYSSNGFPGLGGLDFYYSEYSSPWSKPKHLPYPMNSSRDDFGIMLLDEETGFLSSNRSGEGETDMIYRFSTNKPQFMVVGKIRNSLDDSPIENAQIRIIEKEGQKENKLTSSATGGFEDKLLWKKNYQLIVSHQDFISDSSTISTMGLKTSKTFQEVFRLDAIPVEKPLALNEIYYDFDEFKIRKDASLELDHLAKILKEQKDLEIELSAHCDSRGSHEYNLWLSRMRAYSALNYLGEKGIKKDRMTPKWHGETQLVNHCKDGVKCTETEHQKNRRTTFQVINLDKGLTSDHE